MKLQAAVDKLFSHKLFSNKYFLYAVVAASILTNYMRIVTNHYEVVGFFILVGIIMMNFSKNIAVVLTVCLLLTQIIMAGKALREGVDDTLEKDFEKGFEKWLTPEQKKELNEYREKIRDIKDRIGNQKDKLTEAEKNIAEATAAISATNAAITANDAVRATANSNQKNQKTPEGRQQIIDAKAKDKTLNDELASAQKKLAKFTAMTTDIKAKLPDLRENLNNNERKRDEIKAKAKAARDAAKASKDSSTATTTVATPAATPATTVATAVPAVATAATTGASAALTDPRKRAAARRRIAAGRLNSLGIQNQLTRQSFALLNESDDDEDDANGFDFIGPSDISGLTQGTTNLMTKQKDLFTVMNSITPLIENAKKMLSGLDLSKLQGE
jgi:small-conductance mechanosensitive channel